MEEKTTKEKQELNLRLTFKRFWLIVFCSFCLIFNFICLIWSIYQHDWWIYCNGFFGQIIFFIIANTNLFFIYYFDFRKSNPKKYQLIIFRLIPICLIIILIICLYLINKNNYNSINRWLIIIVLLSFYPLWPISFAIYEKLIQKKCSKTNDYHTMRI